MSRSDAIDSRSVLLGYRLAAFIAGLAVVGYPWPMPTPISRVPVLPDQLWSLTLMLTALCIWVSGGVAAGFAKIEDPATRRSMLWMFAATLIGVGLLCFAPAYPTLQLLLGRTPWLVVATGAVLFFLSSDTPRARPLRDPLAGDSTGHRGVVFHEKGTLRSQYESRILQAARQEERARLARDLHDAVKQQLFVIQTAAATVETRFDADAHGARTALAQVRSAAREALAEMEVMLEQLQAAPVTNAGLIDSLKRLCDVLKFRTGTNVIFEATALPRDSAFPPGAHQAMLRFAQEAIANVARHARARNVRVSLTTDAGQVTLSISDDGQGFEPAAPRSGMGLGNMATRAAEAQGVLAVTSAPGAGTRVALTTQTYEPKRSAYLTLALMNGAWIVASLFLLVFIASPRALPFQPILLVSLMLSVVALLRYGLTWWRMRA